MPDDFFRSCLDPRREKTGQMSFLGLSGKSFLVVGFANKKSIAWAIAKSLEKEGARVIYSVRNEKRKAELEKIIENGTVLTCDFAHQEEIDRLGHKLVKPPRANWMASFTQLRSPTTPKGSNLFTKPNGKTSFKPHKYRPFRSLNSPGSASLTWRLMLPSSPSAYRPPRLLRKTTDTWLRSRPPSKHRSDTWPNHFPTIPRRFNSVNAGPLKTSASAGIPGYLVNYLYAEKLTYRKRALQTQEVADLATFLLSHRSSGINGQGIVIDAGMGLNYFDREVVEPATEIRK